MSKNGDRHQEGEDNLEEEIIYVDQYGRPLPPPPPYGRPPFPPQYGMPPFPRQGMPFPPPVQWVEEIEVYEDEEEDGEEAETAEPVRIAPKPRPRAASAPRKNAHIEGLQREHLKRFAGDAKSAQALRKMNSRRDVLVKLSKVGLGAVFLCAMIAVCVGFLMQLRSSVIEKSAGGGESVLGGTLIGCRLGDTAEENYVKNFYLASGDAEVGSWRDMLLKGYVDIGGKSEDFYCIKKSNGKTFLKIGVDAASRSYIVGDFVEGVLFLKDGRISGKKETMAPSKALFIRALVSYDASLFSRAFVATGDDRSKNGPIKNEGLLEYDGKKYDAISVEETDGTRVVVYFDTETKLIGVIKYENIAATYYVVYDRYEVYQKPYKVPAHWTVYQNGKVAAIVDISIFERDRGVFFPY